MTEQKQMLKKPKVTQVSLASITIDTATFQFRDENLQEAHADELRSHLKPDEPLDAITLWRNPEATSLVVIDGHHRLEAYKRFGWRGKVPARVYSCSLPEARKLALEENAKTRLPMTSQERKNAAWRLVCMCDADGQIYSKSEVVALRLASDGTVAKMRRTRLELIEVDDVLPDTWLEALEMLRGFERKNEDWDADAWVQERADALDGQIGKLIGYEGDRCFDAVRIVLEKRLGRRVEDLADYWRPEPDDEDALPF